MIIEPLADHHDRGDFSCGVEALDNYLQYQAGQDVRRWAAAVYVAVESECPNKILGYFTLSSASVPLQEFPPEVSKRWPRYPQLPTTLLGRLAVSNAHRGKGIGRELLIDALALSLGQSRKIGSVGVVVDAKDDLARRFYQKYGFAPLADHPRRLFLSMKIIEQMVQIARKPALPR